jgi:two-component system, NarL family, sensor histidine kinase DesK
MSWARRSGRVLLASWALVVAAHAPAAVAGADVHQAWAAAVFFGLNLGAWVVFWLWIAGSGRRAAAAAAVGACVAALALADIAGPRGTVGAGDALALGLVMAGAGFGWRAGLAVVGALELLLVGMDAGSGMPPLAILGAFGALGPVAIAGRLLVGGVHALGAARAEIARRAVADERLRFARDLHDVLGHRLAVIALRADLAAETLTPATAVQHRERLVELRAVAGAALEEVARTVSGYEAPGLEGELESACRTLRSVGIEPIARDGVGPVSDTAAQVLALALREGVTNVIKHSGARRCWVSLERVAGAYRLELADDGRGAGTPGQGAGLRGIGERAAAAGGDVAVERGPPGFRLEVRIPMAEAPR